MEWQVVKIKQADGRSSAFVSIGRGQFDFNAEACKLVGDTGNFKFAQLLTAQEDGKVVVAVKFLEEDGEDRVAIRRKNIDGKIIQGMTVRHKGTIEKLFGKNGVKQGMTRYPVTLVAKNTLKIID
ncbi:MAG: hypothetical protein K2L12_02355 [Clostridia bacterium]|nr:hypothetical protein [Clostridia bacterium]